MKKLMLLCFFLLFSGSFYAQDSNTKKEPVKKETVKKKSGYNYDKDVPVKSTKKEVTSKSTATKETVKKETTKKKSGYNYDKDVTVKPAKKEATAKSVAKKETVSKETKKKVTKAPTLKESNEKAPKTPDKVTGKYNGKKVYTGPRGGKYYINKNGNKTYIQD